METNAVNAPTGKVVGLILYSWLPSQDGQIRREGAPEFWLSKRLQGSWRGMWQFPGGSVERGENTLTAIFREVKEETGLRDRMIHPVALSTSSRVHPVKGPFELAMFSSELTYPNAPQWTEPHEQSAWVPFSLYEVLRLNCVPGLHEDLLDFCHCRNYIPHL